MLDDGGMGAASCAIADLNDDGRPDVACIGSATTNLKWYENRKSEPGGSAVGQTPSSAKRPQVAFSQVAAKARCAIS